MSERPAERPDSCHLGLLTDGDPSEEQLAALSAVESMASVETVDLSSITSPADFEQYDVLWWHRARADPQQSLSRRAADAIESFAHDGGGLFLSLYALTVVDFLDIDPHVPDRIEETRVPNHEWGHQPAGLLQRSRFSESVVFEQTDGLRVHTQPSESESAPKIAYEKLVPRYGDVLASAVVGEDDRPSQNTVVAWNHGAGRVLGVGQHFVFTEVSASVRETVESLLAGFVAYLDGADAPRITGRPKSGSELDSIRTALDRSDHNRPTYHFAPPANWLNDPNGLIQWNGTYHLFYQYNPAGPYHGSIHWGHAVSEDLVHWEDRPVALTPDPGGPDEHGCWSGCAVEADGTPTFVYTGGSGGDQLPCLARASTDSLDDWEKYPQNPVIEDPPPADLDILSNEHWNAEFRDHDVWFEDGIWYHLIGSGITGEGGTALLYTGETLTDWEFVGPALVGDQTEHGGMWECPELLRFADCDVLQVSNYDKVVYFTGEFDGEVFERQHSGVVDHGNYYAAQTMTDDDGRALSWGWIREDRDESAQWNVGWSGVMSVPREFSVDDGRPVIEPAAELSQLRNTRQSITDTTLTPESEDPLEDVSGTAIEIDVTVELEDADAFELVLRESPDEAERTPIRYTSDGELVVDRERSSLAASVTETPQTIEDVSTDDGRVHLRIFLDGSVVEVFANSQTSLSSRLYPTREDSTGLACVAVGGSVRIHDCQVYAMDSAFENRPETESTTAVR